MATDSKFRVVIAVTETTPVSPLWHAAMQVLEESPAELVALFVEDDRWRLAASLPFTREFSRIGGTEVDFTRQRAEQISREVVARVHQVIRRLAADAELTPNFEVSRESDRVRIKEIVGSSQNVLVAPSCISNWPIYAMLSKLECRILLVEACEESERSPGY